MAASLVRPTKTDSGVGAVYWSSAAECSRVASPHQHQSIMASSCWDRKVQCSSQLPCSFDSDHMHITHTLVVSHPNTTESSTSSFICEAELRKKPHSPLIPTSTAHVAPLPDSGYWLPCFGWSSRHKSLLDPFSWWQERSLSSPSRKELTFTHISDPYSLYNTDWVAHIPFLKYQIKWKIRRWSHCLSCSNSPLTILWTDLLWPGTLWPLEAPESVFSYSFSTSRVTLARVQTLKRPPPACIVTSLRQNVQ